jgi:hypothetical protein
MVHPEVRGRGYGAALLDWALDRPGPVTVETEGLTPAAGKLFVARGLRRVFAELVMRIDLNAPAPLPGQAPASLPGQTPTRPPGQTAAWPPSQALRRRQARRRTRRRTRPQAGLQARPPRGRPEQSC